jgi:co-chaperonin GroES (HSP10)
VKLLNNDLLIRRVTPVKSHGGIDLPPEWTDEFNNGICQMFKLVAKGPGRVTKKGVRILFEAQPGDNLIVFPITTGPQDVGNGMFILKKPEESVLAVVPVQIPPAPVSASV